MKPFRFHRAALAEAKAAAEHYYHVNPALGQRFYESLEKRVEEIRVQPSTFRVFDPPLRRHFRRPFPYAVIYLDRPDLVWIVAIMHFKQRPGYWRKRLR